jgi:hypothetical protein
MAAATLPDPNAPQQSPLPLAQQPAIPKPTVAAPAQPVDRLQLATDQFNTFSKATDPAYQKSISDANAAAFGRGQGGGGVQNGATSSGQLRTSIGDLSLARQRDLDTERDTLLQHAQEGSIADASTAFQQALAGSQQGLAQQLGTGNLSIAQQQADTAKTGTLGSLGVQQGQLELAKTAQATGAEQTQQQIDLAKKTADINAAYQSGTLTLAQKDQALRELANTQQNTLATGQLTLAQQQAGVQNAIAAAGLTGIYNGTQTIQAKSQAIQDAIAQGRLTVEQGQLAWRSLTEKDSERECAAAEQRQRGCSRTPSSTPRWRRARSSSRPRWPRTPGSSGSVSRSSWRWRSSTMRRPTARSTRARRRGRVSCCCNSRRSSAARRARSTPTRWPKSPKSFGIVVIADGTIDPSKLSGLRLALWELNDQPLGDSQDGRRRVRRVRAGERRRDQKGVGGCGGCPADEAGRDRELRQAARGEQAATR